MVIIEAAGGLGNQLQQYALYRKFVSLGKVVKMDISWFDEKNQEKMFTERKLELSYLNGVVYDVCSPKEKKALVGGRDFAGKLRRKLLPFTIRHFQERNIYHPELFSYDHMFLSGYFACEKYYSDILNSLREEIGFPESDNPLNREMAQEMRKGISVSVHVRRGDYLNPENQTMFGGICTDKYYESAIKAIKREQPDARFYLFSDDISYVREKYAGKEYTVVDINHGKDSFYDMWLMSCCKHNICANSTFSFWGARMNGYEGKIMIRPTIHKNTQKFDKEEMEELWQGWRFISPEGKEY